MLEQNSAGVELPTLRERVSDIKRGGATLVGQREVLSHDIAPTRWHLRRRSASLPAVGAKEIAARIRFVVDGQGQVTSVVLTPELWREIVEGLEDAEDRKLLKELAPKLSAGPQDALRWTAVERDWA